MTTPCPTCRGIHTLVTPRFCPECGEQLLELPVDHLAGRLEPYPEHVINTGTDCGKSTTVNTAEHLCELCKRPMYFVGARPKDQPLHDRRFDDDAHWRCECGFKSNEFPDPVPPSRDFIEKAGAE